jgi:hypothetical protein
VVLVVGLALGIGVARVTFAGDGGGAASTPMRRTDTAVTLPELAAVDVPPAGIAAPDPRSAVEGFLEAEAARDFGRSWGLLAAEDRVRYGSPAAWVAAHEAIPPVTGFLVEAAGDDGAVAALLELRPGLDGVLGLVPARAESTWQTVNEDGGWRVAFGLSSLRPLHPSDAGAVDAALSWVQDRQACQDRPARQHGALVGVTGLADRLCDAAGVPQAAGPGRLPAADAARFVSAYGPDVVDWARTVDIDGAVPLRAVLAPIGDDWFVVGVLPPTP